MSAIDILKFVEYEDYYLNVSIAYRVLLTVHVTVALVEKKFFKIEVD
jgi:hypothetical protein